MCEILYRAAEHRHYVCLWQCVRKRWLLSVCKHVYVCLCVHACKISGCVCVFAVYMRLRMQVCTLSIKAFQESVWRTWQLCNLWHSKDFQLSVSSCMAKQQREELHNYKDLKNGCVIHYLLKSLFAPWISGLNFSCETTRRVSSANKRHSTFLHILCRSFM